MQLKWTRPKFELRDVLLDPTANGPETAYWIFDIANPAKWTDMTVLAPGYYGKEYPKTYGHYHPPNTLETYKLVSGEGVLLLQKKHVENGKWVPEIVDEVYIVKFEAGEELVIPNEFGHSWSNLGPTPLLTFDDWNIKHTPTDYNEIKTLKGMAFYLVNDNGLKFVPNPNYENLPEPQIVTVKQFAAKYPA